ncbi:MAG: PmbA/TldA family metallopeptidase, partial [Actinomycetota bacterium]
MQEKKLTGICKEVAKNLEGKNLDGYEVYASNSVENDIEVFEGRVDSLSFSDSSGIGIRVFKDNAIGYAYTSMLEGSSISDCVERAIENSRITTKEDINALPGKEEYLYPEKTTGTDSLFSKNYFKLKPEEKIKATKDLEKITKGKDNRIKGIQDVMYHDNALEVALINSKG